jgi:hypothetical protein
MSEAPSKYFFRQRHQNRLYEVVVRALEASGMRRKDIASRLGIPASQVTRLLSGPANWTNDTTSDLLFAVNAELDFHVAYLCDQAKGNRYHPAGGIMPAPVVTQGTSTISSGTVTITTVSPTGDIFGGQKWITELPQRPDA